jgi:predicted DNA-binding transcriptional regulator YafY
MRADRLLSLVLLLQARGRMPAPKVAERLEVSVRTVMRDIEALSAAGIPVYTERGRNGGVRLLEGYRAGLTNLSRREAASLSVGQPRLTRELGLGDALDTALEKITGAGGAALRGGIEHGRSLILVDVDPWMRAAEAVPLLPQVHDGLSQARRIELDYRDSNDRDRRVTVDPLGLVAKAGVWYLVATPKYTDHASLFRISRIRGCEILDASAIRPEGFDLGEAWQTLREHVEVRERELRCTIEVDLGSLPMVRRLLAAHINREDGLRLYLSFGAVAHAVGSLIGLGRRIEVVDPPEVRSAMRAAAEDLLQLYGEAREDV